MAEKQGNVQEQIILLIVDYVKKLVEENDRNCDDIYRVISEYARMKNIPRNVIVHLRTKRMRYEIQISNTESHW